MLLVSFMGAPCELRFFWVHLGALSYTSCIIGLRPFKFALFCYTTLLTYKKKKGYIRDVLKLETHPPVIASRFFCSLWSSPEDPFLFPFDLKSPPFPSLKSLFSYPLLPLLTPLTLISPHSPWILETLA